MLSKFDKICTLALLVALCLPGCKEGNGGGAPDEKGQKGLKNNPEKHGEPGEPGSDDEGEGGEQQPNTPQGEGAAGEPGEEGEANAPTGEEGKRKQPSGNKEEGLVLENSFVEGDTIAVTVSSISRAFVKLSNVILSSTNIGGFTVERVEGNNSCVLGQDFKNSCFLYFKITAPVSFTGYKVITIPITLVDGNGKEFPGKVTEGINFK